MSIEQWEHRLSPQLQVKNANFEAQNSSSWRDLPRRSAWVPPQKIKMLLTHMLLNMPSSSK
eukprot:6267294-Amphidinium_carterae.1